MKIKENTKKNVLSGALGAAAGVAGAMGASELSGLMNGNDEELIEEDVAQDVPEQENETAEVETEETFMDHIIAQDEDIDEIVPVDSGGVGQVTSGGNEIAMVDVNPDEIAQEIIAEPVDDEMLLASHGEEVVGEDIETFFEEEAEPAGDPTGLPNDVAEAEIDDLDMEGDIDDFDVEETDDFADADTDDDMMADMVDDIG